MKSSRRNCLWAAGTGVVAFAVYIQTLAPGLIGIVDTPMFQFIGRVLGVAHNPGYPLYVFLTNAFSYVPIGSLAYRINIFSALAGAVTVSSVFLIAWQLGCRTIIIVAAALTLPFGRVFWSQAVIAEVYTLNSVIVAGMLLALLAWGGESRRRGLFLRPSACSRSVSATIRRSSVSRRGWPFTRCSSTADSYFESARSPRRWPC